ncbi:MAG: alpha/beta fold hydrolase, partial [Opitutaceae bacterium]|nr:alpha/beta fold hydrolase [Cytophagales bacterium]
MPVYNPSYNPPFPYKNGHIHTILSFLFRNKKPLNYLRSILQTKDGDFLALDKLPNLNNRCAILVHGLEGSSESGYITSLAAYLNKLGWDIVALNLRGCSGVDNSLFNAYHSGIIEDLDQVVDHLRLTYNQITIIGFSLGGNIVLKYMGFLGKQNLQKVIRAAAVSVPCHLSSSSDKLETWENYIYNRRFIIALKNKLKKKMNAFPGRISQNTFEAIKTIRQLDDAYTGPANGFEDAEDYYTNCSSLSSLKFITTPTLLINAQDDPFLTELC